MSCSASRIDQPSSNTTSGRTDQDAVTMAESGHEDRFVVEDGAIERCEVADLPTGTTDRLNATFTPSAAPGSFVYVQYAKVVDATWQTAAEWAPIAGPDLDNLWCDSVPVDF
jgi:hypothetical protein